MKKSRWVIWGLLFLFCLFVVSPPAYATRSYARDVAAHCENQADPAYRTQHSILLVTNPEFAGGAQPNDNMDDSAAMSAAAERLCRTPGQTLIYPAGRYFLDRASGRTAIRYDSCEDAQILGCNHASIHVKNPAHGEIIPFSFYGSERFHLEGFELNGGAHRLTNMSRGGRGVVTESSHEYSVRKVTAHHFSIGFVFGWGNWWNPAPWQDYGIHAEDITAVNNRLSGIYIANVNFPPGDPRRTATGPDAEAAAIFIRPTSRNNGKGVKPDESGFITGIDIEPVGNWRDENGTKYVSLTNHLRFTGCRLGGNKRYNLAIVSQPNVFDGNFGVVGKQIFLKDCKISYDER